MKVYVIFTLGKLGFQNIAAIASSMEKALEIKNKEKHNTPYEPYIGVYELDQFPSNEKERHK
jgi:hypothetical protein